MYFPCLKIKQNHISGLNIEIPVQAPGRKGMFILSYATNVLP